MFKDCSMGGLELGDGMDFEISVGTKEEVVGEGQDLIGLGFDL
jgi:hypothetical protein